MQFIQQDQALICRRQGETLRIEPWGKDSLRVRATMYPDFCGRDWALTEQPAAQAGEIRFYEEKHREGDGSFRGYPIASIANGRMIYYLRGLLWAGWR